MKFERATEVEAEGVQLPVLGLQISPLLRGLTVELPGERGAL